MCKKFLVFLLKKMKKWAPINFGAHNCYMKWFLYFFNWFFFNGGIFRWSAAY